MSGTEVLDIAAVPTPHGHAHHATGPKTDDGKNHSKRNAAKHGLTGSGAGLSPHDADELDRRAAAFADCLKPADPFEHALVRQLALADFRGERCARLELTLDGIEAHRARVCWEEDRMLDAEELGRTLADDPAGTRLRLRRTAHGCAWLITQLQHLDNFLQDQTAELTVEIEDHLLDLLGVSRRLREVDPTARWVQVAGYRLRVGRPDAAEARSRLRATLAEAVAELCERRELLRDQVEAHERALRARGAWFIDTPSLRLLRRYGSAADRLFARSLQQLEIYRREKVAISASDAPSQHRPAPVAPAPAPPPPPPPTPSRPPAPASSFVNIRVTPDSTGQPGSQPPRRDRLDAPITREELESVRRTTAARRS